MDKLKSCPFCGGTKLKIEKKSKLAGFNGLDERVEQHTFSVRCNCCYARGGAIGGKVIPHRKLFEGKELPYPEWAKTDDELKELAVDIWNRRAGETNGS